MFEMALSRISDLQGAQIKVAQVRQLMTMSLCTFCSKLVGLVVKRSDSCHSNHWRHIRQKKWMCHMCPSTSLESNTELETGNVSLATATCWICLSQTLKNQWRTEMQHFTQLVKQLDQARMPNQILQMHRRPIDCIDVEVRQPMTQLVRIATRQRDVTFEILLKELNKTHPHGRRSFTAKLIKQIMESLYSTFNPLSCRSCTKIQLCGCQA